MKKNVFLVLILFHVYGLQAQPNIKVYSEKVDNGYVIYADNDEYCPVSIQLDFRLKNLLIKEPKNGEVYLIEEKTSKKELVRLVIDKSGLVYEFSFKWFANIGNHMQEEYNSDFKYFLPFEKGTAFWVHQGYNGSFSHQGKSALDFTMDEGTVITAARQGIVVEVVQKNKKHCAEERCKEFSNYVTIYHSDGTFAKYVHLKKNGSYVSVGDEIKQGQKIALSGNTGWSTGPHLHFEVYLQRLRKKETIDTKFLIEDGSSSNYLREKKKYKRAY